MQQIQVLPASGKGQKIRTQGHGNNKLEGTRGEFSAQIVYAVNQLSLHFNTIRKNFTH